MLRIGHKGADAIVPGNSVESFHAAVEAGVDAIEFDVLRPPEDFADGSDWRAAPAGPANGSGPLLVAHDWAAARRTAAPLTLDEALDAFTESPLDTVKIDLDIKICGREDEIADAVRTRGLAERTMTSGTELATIRALGEIAPELSRGWTVPRVSRDWTKARLLKPVVLGGMAAYRARLPGAIRRNAPLLGVKAIWTHQGLATPALTRAAHDSDCILVAWTVDDAQRMRELEAMGVDGICTNDPRLFQVVDS
ncbi:MAG TPA: glycerophosphodiester phosphodiesterase [Solirubrobacterales bacterium]|nr:glycerophosphodiester phosphodiesterase [Solirubrobacterales bacterium]